jgi:hypothetical protein
MPTLKSLILLLPLLTACPVGPAARGPLPKERLTECEQMCTDLGLTMSALVIIYNSAGCVCQRPDAKGSTTAAVGAAAGGATIAVIAEQQQALAQGAPSPAPVR